MPESAATADITVVVLTLDEQRHLQRCIESVRPLASRIVVVDSGSTDGTAELARTLGADVLAHPFHSHAAQFNWALSNAAISTPWVMKMDADEYLVPGAAAALSAATAVAPPDVAGLTMNLRRVFMGRWLRHGSLYPIRLLRVFRVGRGMCEVQWMDEHISVDGRVVHVNADFADHNLKSITWWTEKHNAYASREVVDILMSRSPLHADASDETKGFHASLKRWVKRKVYGRLPLGVRAMGYFVYRYVLRLGFLDGWPGFVFHFLQGWWYRMLVDVKLYEVERAMREEDIPLEQAVQDILGVRLPVKG